MSASRYGFQRNGVPEISEWQRQRWLTEVKKFKDKTGVGQLVKRGCGLFLFCVANCFPWLHTPMPKSYYKETEKGILCRKYLMNRILLYDVNLFLVFLLT